MTKYQKKLDSIEDKIVKNTDAIRNNAKTIGKFKVKFDDFLGNHFTEVKDDVKWLKKISWWQMGVIASIFVSIVIALIFKVLL